jgi:hypothetical protein
MLFAYIQLATSSFSFLSSMLRKAGYVCLIRKKSRKVKPLFFFYQDQGMKETLPFGASSWNIIERNLKTKVPGTSH